MPVRFSDIGHAEDGVENEKIRSWHNGERALILAVYRQPGSNTVEVVSKLREMLPEIENEMPSGATLNVLVDRSEFIRDSIHEVNFTLVLSIALVIGVILVFLRNIRATMVTALVLPASVLGTFAVMSLLGFSLNNLSLMAITLAVGFVVDDAIVVLENITRHMEMGKDRMRGGARRRQGDRLHGHDDDHFALGGVPADPVHGGHGRTAVPRVRGHRRHRRADLRRGVAVDHADAVQPAAAARARARTAVQLVGARVRCGAHRLRRQPALDAEFPRLRAAGLARRADRDGLALRRRIEGLHSAPGYRCHQRQSRARARALRSTI